MPTAILLNPDDPLYNFEQMMSHRQYFAVMELLTRFSALPYLLDPPWETNLPAGMWNLLHQQAHNDFNRTLPSNYANGYSITVVTPPTASGTGTSTGTTTLTVTAVTNTIMVGATVAGTGVPAGTTIVSGPGGAGTYTTNQPTTLTNAALTFTHPPYNQANSLSGGTFGIPQTQILIEGVGGDPASRAWWTFINFEEHHIADQAILPLPTTAPTTAGSPPGVANVSNPWWWTTVAPVIYPFW